jgi:hypothetical protein|tara:strand:- start:701 stop:1204 length:504 start_codon:yes stop_codon:yes gene_type:complete
MILIVSPAFVKENTVLHYNVDDGYLKPLIDSIQNTFVRPILGSALFKEVQVQIKDGTVSALNEILIKEYLRDALKWEVCHKYTRIGTYKLNNKGAGTHSGDNFGALDKSELVTAKSIFKDNADFYRKKLSLYLKANASDYPLYQNAPSGIDVVQPQIDTKWRSQFIL